MIKFEDLPINARALILAKLAIELGAQNAVDIHHLARKTNIDVRRLWRSLCRKAQLPVCTIPIEAISEQ